MFCSERRRTLKNWKRVFARPAGNSGLVKLLKKQHEKAHKLGPIKQKIYTSEVIDEFDSDEESMEIEQEDWSNANL